jgi:hypothetical protein
MPFVKTEVDIRTDYTVETVDPEWLKQGVKSPKHLMLELHLYARPRDRADLHRELG